MTELFAEFEAATQKQWLDAARASLRGRPLDELVARSYEGIDIHPLTVAGAESAHARSLPGQYPFVRGTQAAGYRNAPWLIAQEINIADAREFNVSLLDALVNGQNAIMLGDSLQLRAPADLGRALADVDLSRLPIFAHSARSLERASALYDLLRAVFDADTVSRLQGCIGGDPLGDLARNGAMPADAYERLSAHVDNAAAHSEQLGSIAVDTAVYHNAGANAVQELALALATGVAYFRALSARGCSLEELGRRTHVFLSIGEDFFLEIAKFRAIKLIWAQMTRAFGIKGRGQKITLHARSGRRNKTRRDPHVNLLRLTAEALAAAFGGVESISIAPFDQAPGASGAFSRRLSRNLQLILQEELQLTQLIDPAGGAWHIDGLTDQLARKAWAQFQEIEARGGMLACLRSGYVQAEIDAIADMRRRDMAAGESILVGGNKYAEAGGDLPPLPSPSSAGSASLGDNAITARALEAIRLAAPFETESPGSEAEA